MSDTEPTLVGDQLPPVTEPTPDAPPTSDAHGESPAVELVPEPAPQPEQPDAPAEPHKHGEHHHKLKKLAGHFGAPHTGDDDETAKKIGELTGHSHLDTEALVKELASLTGH